MSSFRRRQMMAAAGAEGAAEAYIVFADPVVEAICAQNWGDGVGITPSQAAAVTSIRNNVFSGNTQITSFKELIYFTGLTTIDHGTFKNCSSLTTIGIPASCRNWGTQGCYALVNICVTDIDVITKNTRTAYTAASGTNNAVHLYLNDVEVTSITVPSSVTSIIHSMYINFAYITSFILHNDITSIGNQSFSRCASWVSNDLVLPSSLTSIGYEAFVEGTGLTKVTLPATLNSIGYGAFDRCRALETVVCLATSVPTAGNNVFRNTSNGLKIYVPYSADHSILDAYKMASGWSPYASRIFELNPDGTIPS